MVFESPMRLDIKHENAVVTIMESNTNDNSLELLDLILIKAIPITYIKQANPNLIEVSLININMSVIISRIIYSDTNSIDNFLFILLIIFTTLCECFNCF